MNMLLHASAWKQRGAGRHDIDVSRAWGRSFALRFRRLVPSVLPGLMVALIMLGVAGPVRPAAADEPTGFRAEVDLSPLARIAVQSEGRLKSFDSFANGMMHFVSGPRRIAGQSPSYTYLDMMFRPEAYTDADVIYVKNKSVRLQLAEALTRSRPELADRMQIFVRTGLISSELVTDPALLPLVTQLQSDLIRTAKQVDAIETALAVMRPATLLNSLRIVPRPGEPDGRWIGIAEAIPTRDAAGQLTEPVVPGLDDQLARTIAGAWQDLVSGWRRGDAASVNSALAALAAALPEVEPEAYPSSRRLELESWYFRADNMSWTWLVYMLSAILLVMATVYRWRPALWLGFGAFAIAFTLQTAAVGIRWYISGRWPNSNMFEAVTTAAWFGGCCAVVLEILLRRTGMRGLFALGSGVASMVALMAVHFLPAQLNANISNMMPVLHDVWLYIHTNVIIFSYCLIFMAAVSAFMYLLWRAFGGPASYARVGGAASIILAGGPGAATAGTDVMSREDGELIRGRLAGLAGRGSGGASGSVAVELIEDNVPRSRFGEVLDGVTMILMEISFVLLWAGIVMGAIWADHSWGRPWGWDPKEVFALNTFIVFALLIHVRLKVRDKGLWTAILAVVGAGVMLFNWIVINFVITGLHSYA